MFKNKQENMAAQDASNSSNIIGKGTMVEGNIETFGNIRIEGKVNGSVKSKSKIALGSLHLLREMLSLKMRRYPEK